MKYLAVDIGSTYTKVTAIDGDLRKIVGTARAFTTIADDVTLGLQRALDALGDFVWDDMFVCSSAAGGLKMVALGLVPDLTAKAARTAASNAGAKVMQTFAYEISKREEQEIYDSNPDLVLLCGGTDGGNKEVITANARRLCSIPRPFTTIVAGNKSAADEIVEIFEAAGKPYVLTENVMPEFNRLNIEPARDAIRQLFISRIVEAKGLKKVQAQTPHQIIPTPLAVLQACELLSRGTEQQEGLGDLMAVDVGGATTDVYSMASGAPSVESTLTKGLPEPWSKRTVEGDLGMRYSLIHVLEQMTCPSEDLRLWVESCMVRPDMLAAAGSKEERLEEELGRMAVALAVERHCGRMADVYTPLGQMHTLEGKDLMNVPLMIGIGGVILGSRRPEEILKGCLYDLRHPEIAKPRNPRLVLDSQYIFAAAGLLSQTDCELAFDLLRANLKEVGKYSYIP